jgi:hypothetical protein
VFPKLKTIVLSYKTPIRLEEFKYKKLQKIVFRNTYFTGTFNLAWIRDYELCELELYHTTLVMSSTINTVKRLHMEYVTTPNNVFEYAKFPELTSLTLVNMSLIFNGVANNLLGIRLDTCNYRYSTYKITAAKYPKLTSADLTNSNVVIEDYLMTKQLMYLKTSPIMTYFEASDKYIGLTVSKSIEYYNRYLPNLIMLTIENNNKDTITEEYMPKLETLDISKSRSIGLTRHSALTTLTLRPDQYNSYNYLDKELFPNLKHIILVGQNIKLNVGNVTAIHPTSDDDANM